MDGFIGGVASQVGSRFLGSTYGGVIGLGAAGYFTGNSTLMTLAGINASALVPVGNLLGGTTSSSGVI